MQRTSALVGVARLLQRRCGQSLFVSESAISQLLAPCSGCPQQLHAVEQQQHGWGCPISWMGPGVRHMAGRTHRLSLKHVNNKASWLAVQPFLQQQPGTAAAATPRPPKPKPVDTAIPPLPQLQEPPAHRRIGRITGPYAVTPAAAFAVVESGSAQFKVTPDDVIYHNKIPGAVVNDVLQFGKVLLVGSQTETVVGRPFIPGASVIAVVEEVLKDSKVHVFKKKKRKGYSTLHGHRSHITVLRIVELRAPGLQQQQPQQQQQQQLQQQQQEQQSVAASGSRKRAAAAAAPAGRAAAAQEAPVRLLKGRLEGPPPALVGLAVEASKSTRTAKAEAGKA